MNNKGEGLTLSTIIVAVIVLIVLVVTVAIFTGYFGNFIPGLNNAAIRECAGDGIYDASEAQGCNNNPGDRRIYGNFNEQFKSQNRICCKEADFTEPEPEPEIDLDAQCKAKQGGPDCFDDRSICNDSDCTDMGRCNNGRFCLIVD